jgi:hypothetical protein
METVVGILITTLFVSLSLQGIVVAKLIQSKAMMTADANRWIQTDIEAIRNQLSSSNFTVSNIDRYCQATDRLDGFAKLTRDRLVGAETNTNNSYYLPPISTVSRTGQTFEITRKATIPTGETNYHHKILGIEYQVMRTRDRSAKQAIINIYTEVMPDVALQCS